MKAARAMRFPAAMSLALCLLAACAPSQPRLQGDAFEFKQPKTEAECLAWVKTYYDARAKEYQRQDLANFFSRAYSQSNAEIDSEQCRDYFDPVVKYTRAEERREADGSVRTVKTDTWMRESEIRRIKEQEAKDRAASPGSGVDRSIPPDPASAPKVPTIRHGGSGCRLQGALESLC